MPITWKTKLIHSDTKVSDRFRSLATPIYRGSTTLFERSRDLRDDWHHDDGSFTYGLYGTPTTLELANRIAELENGHRTFLTQGGQAALSLVYLSCLEAETHVLIPESVYGPSRDIAERLLGRMRITAEYYDALEGALVERRIRSNTRLIWCESPGSNTMEIQDVPGIAEVAHRHNIVVALDNTYAAGVLFDAFSHGVDISVQALTKYIGGHSDLLLGSVTVRSPELYERIGTTLSDLGQSVSPDDCALALRGLQTLSVRLSHLEASALTIARWLANRPEIELVLHPALPSCPGHEYWKRDFRGSASVFSIVVAPHFTRDQLYKFMDRLSLFKIGYSWGGVASLAVPCFGVRRTVRSYGDRLIRFNIGLEDTQDLIRDLEQAFAVLH
jgi:cysteine-S-conjugate beta-lyase